MENKKIIIIDDVFFVTKAIKDVCTILGHNVIIYLNAEAALRDIDIIQTADLIITDLNLPGKSGLEFIKEIREQNILNNVLVISGNQKLITKTKEFKNTDYILKPIDKEKLKLKIKQLT